MPENLSISDVDFESVTVTWTPDVTNHALAYVVNVYNAVVNIFDTVYSSNVTIRGLYSEMDYNVRVRSACSATTYSDWCEAVPFSTSSCQPVSNVSASVITYCSAIIAWTPQGDATRWEVEYGFNGFDVGAGTTVTVTEPTLSIVGLQDETGYDAYVRSVCSDDVFSSWSRVSFTTLPYVGISDVEGDVSCTIYPNPASTETTISVSSANGLVRIAVVDMNGRTVASDELSCSADCTKQMTVEGLAQGAYFVRIVGDNINIVRKLVVR